MRPTRRRGGDRAGQDRGSAERRILRRSLGRTRFRSPRGPTAAAATGLARILATGPRCAGDRVAARSSRTPPRPCAGGPSIRWADSRPRRRAIACSWSCATRNRSFAPSAARALTRSYVEAARTRDQRPSAICCSGRRTTGFPRSGSTPSARSRTIGTRRSARLSLPLLDDQSPTCRCRRPRRWASWAARGGCRAGPASWPARGPSPCAAPPWSDSPAPIPRRSVAAAGAWQKSPDWRLARPRRRAGRVAGPGPNRRRSWPIGTAGSSRPDSRPGRRRSRARRGAARGRPARCSAHAGRRGAKRRGRRRRRGRRIRPT